MEGHEFTFLRGDGNKIYIKWFTKIPEMGKSNFEQFARKVFLKAIAGKPEME